MSYNTIKVCGQSPNDSGEIGVGIGDISDIVISSIGSDQLIQYNSTNSRFENSTNSLKFRDRGAGGGDGNSTVSSTAQHAIPNPYHSNYTYFWEFAAKKIAGTNRFSNVSDSNTQFDGNSYGGGATVWFDHVTFLVAGTYYLSAMVHIGESSSSGAYLDVSWADGSYNSLGPRVRVQRYNDKRIIVRGIYEAAVNDVAGLYMHAISSAYATQSTYVNYLVSVEKV
jgi:hypothetical protein